MRKFLAAMGAVIMVFGLAAVAQAGPAKAPIAKNGVVFNSVPDALPGNVPSLGFQATQASEFGDEVRFQASPKKHLKAVTVVMSSWACKTEGSGNCVTPPKATFPMPITFNIYNASTGGVPGTLIATRTQTFKIKFRPSADAVNCTGSLAGDWFSTTDESCYSGLAQKITFNFASLHLKLPTDIVYGVAYNTSGYGADPYGYGTDCAIADTCPYDSLNVGAAAGLPKRGTDVYPDGVFWNTQTASNYCDDGTAGTGTFRLDDATPDFSCSWTGYNPLVRFQNSK